MHIIKKEKVYPFLHKLQNKLVSGIYNNYTFDFYWHITDIEVKHNIRLTHLE